jgi:O-antigen ligase
MRRADPLGDRIHAGLACLAGLGVASDTTAAEIGFFALLVIFLLRLPKITPYLGSCFRMVLAWILVAWFGYAALSLAWSSDPAQGAEELLRLRFVLLPLLVYPVVDRAAPIFVSILLGVGLLHLAQLLQVLDWMPESIDRDRWVKTRYSGLMHPVASANIIVAAAALHLGALLVALGSPGRRRLATLSALGLGAALVGLVLTGSRGPWLAALALLPAQLLATALRRPTIRKAALILVAVLVLLAGVASIWLAPLAAQRFEQAREDLRQVVQEQDYASHTGARLFMARVALEMFTSKPLIGHGGGSYRRSGGDVAERLLADEDDVKPRSLIHGHAHNLYLHEMATRGVIGLALVLAVLVGGIVTATRGSEAPGAAPWRAGLPWAIAGIALCAMFDHPLITHNNAYFTMLLMALALGGPASWAAAPTRPTAQETPGATSNR